MKKPLKTIIFTLLMLVVFYLAFTTYRSSAVYNDNAQRHKNMCDQGDANACESLGIMYAKGQGFKQSHVTARKFFHKSCDLGNAEICEHLGKIYKNGERVRKDVFKSFENYKKSCELGRKVGCYNLGMMYSNGRGTRQNDACAEQAFTKACALGGARTSYLVGVFYSGKGPLNSHYFIKAKEYFEQGCEGKETKACSELASLYEHGAGVEKNLKSALEYYGKSCDLEDSLGCKKYAELNVSLSQ